MEEESAWLCKPHPHSHISINYVLLCPNPKACRGFVILIFPFGLGILIDLLLQVNGDSWLNPKGWFEAVISETSRSLPPFMLVLKNEEHDTCASAQDCYWQYVIHRGGYSFFGTYAAGSCRTTEHSQFITMNWHGNKGAYYSVERKPRLRQSKRERK